MKDYSVVNSEIKFKGKIFDVIRDEITLPDGKTALRDVVKNRGAAAILAVEENGKILFVRQYRHPAGENMLEIPAGLIEPGEEPLTCAKRELEEETSFKAGKITFILKLFSSPGFSNEQLYIYLAEDLQKGRLNLDSDEFIDIEYYSFDDAVAMIFNGEITDAKTIAAIFACREFILKR